MILSPIIAYIVLGIVKVTGATYEISLDEAFIVWLLMAILISQCWVWKK